MSHDLVLEAWDSDEELPKLQVEYADYKKQCKLMYLLHQLSYQVPSLVGWEISDPRDLKHCMSLLQQASPVPPAAFHVTAPLLTHPYLPHAALPPLQSTRLVSQGGTRVISNCRPACCRMALHIDTAWCIRFGKVELVTAIPLHGQLHSEGQSCSETCLLAQLIQLPLMCLRAAGILTCLTSMLSDFLLRPLKQGGLSTWPNTFTV
jgi:hypothetical protein